MRTLLLVALAASALLSCGPGGTPDSGTYDAGIRCTVASDCPALHCLPDGGNAPPDGGGATMRLCIFNICKESCS